MPGVPRELAEHRIDINESSKPMKQRLRRFSPDKKAAIKKEITKLMAAGFIKEILHPDWLANPVLVQKRIQTNGACVSTTQISTNTARKIHSDYHALIR